MAKRGAHDMGGSPAGAIDTSEHVPTLTERRIDAMMQLLRAKPREFWRTDENRRTIESLAPETYRTSGYYQKWAYAMRGLLVEKGILTEAEIETRFQDVRARHIVVKAAGKSPRRGGGQSAETGSANAKPATAKPRAPPAKPKTKSAVRKAKAP